MNVKTVAVNFERKLNTGNYSSATVGVTLWADIEMDENNHPTEDAKAVLRQLWEMAKASAKEQATQYMTNGGN